MATRRLDKRGMILTAARESFERFGYRRAVIDDIARDAGVAKGTLYLYFKGKEELFLEVVKSMRTEIMENYFERISNEETAIGKIEATLRFSLEAFDDFPLLTRLNISDEEHRLIMSLLGDSDTRREFESNMVFFRGLFVEGIREGSIRADLDLETAPIAFGSLKFMHYSFDPVAAATGISKQRYIDAIVELAMNGITAGGGDKQE